MKKELTKLIAMGAICSLAFGAASCQKEDGKDEVKSYKLELANPADKEIVLNDDDNEPFEITLNTENLTKDQISVESKDEQTWCDASVKDEKTIRVIPSSVITEDDLTATFVVSAKGIDNVEPIEFTVTKKGMTFTIDNISCDFPGFSDQGGMYMCTIPETGATLTLTITTVAPNWFIDYDEEYGVTVNHSGNTCIIEFPANNTGMMKQMMFTFSASENDYGVMLIVMQNPAAASAVKVKAYNVETAEIGEEYQTGYEVDLSDKSTFSFYIESEGGVNFKWTESDGSDEYVDWLDWVGIGMKTDDNGINYYNIIRYNTDYTASCNLVIVSVDGTEEFFRFKITQAAE